jgi:hypothetical protein
MAAFEPPPPWEVEPATPSVSRNDGRQPMDEPRIISLGKPSPESDTVTLSDQPAVLLAGRSLNGFYTADTSIQIIGQCQATNTTASVFSFLGDGEATHTSSCGAARSPHEREPKHDQEARPRPPASTTPTSARTQPSPHPRSSTCPANPARLTPAQTKPIIERVNDALNELAEAAKAQKARHTPRPAPPRTLEYPLQYERPRSNNAHAEQTISTRPLKAAELIRAGYYNAIGFTPWAITLWIISVTLIAGGCMVIQHLMTTPPPTPTPLRLPF